MIHDRRTLTPARDTEAGQDNYTWYKSDGRPYPSQAGFVFITKLGFMQQVIKDYPDGMAPQITGWPEQIGGGCNIGLDGFGWEWDGERYLRFPHLGGVQFGQGVELGSNVTIDRGSLGDTIIGRGVKIDNGVHIAHNAEIGDHTLIVAHAGIGGSVKIGERCWIGFGAYIKNQVTIGDNAYIGMGAIVLKDVPEGETWVGNPAYRLR